ncbi:putative DNA modification/repair radical SAM protein [Rhodobacteraceae bacterium N5(2021)]|uniref:DNA modification/repair radical SAM protein n=1 Tax=Gymnodinialimonas phycosphaerae TaxID=2841589 RepID=A0A975YHM9_9RHOB|nr:putative DNA modification/repair radical SAM protein [Gymnodinialimonas phycosphaerae]MBY4892862.1 putative DNA modification/repair radical SAM protein [Gymnodinialimonas phycosphaerae]
MAKRSLSEKLAVLSDAAKYDASCASSGSTRRDSRDGKGLGSNEGSGICHAYAPDGRCISLLKILMTNFCIYDCAYCVNRVSSNVERARFSIDEVVKLTIEFYRRNYIEGLFLSSGVIRSPDATMSDMVQIARRLRQEENFRGYIHLKTIPDAAPELIAEAGLLADRLSINVELPTDAAVAHYAPEKKPAQIRQAMANVRMHKEGAAERSFTGKRPPRFAPAGQSTQMIIGADGSNDATVLGQSTRLYSSYKLKRVYYSAFSPIPDSSAKLPLIRPPLQREHRLYQADWLLRFYDFQLDEITSVAPDGNLDLEVDPKLAWALANRAVFPVDVNAASREMLLRVPGFGVKTVKRILSTRRHRNLRYDDIARMGALMKKARPFVTALGWTPGGLLDSEALRARFAPPPEQLTLL